MLNDKNAGGFDVRGPVKWLFPAEEVDSHGEQKSLREDMLYYENYHVGITIWETLLEEI